MDLLGLKKNTVTRGVSNKHFLFYGEPSTRKTSVAAQFPDSLILATEIGYKQIPEAVAYDIDSWATFLEAVKELKKPEIKAAYKTIVIDTVDILQDLCVQYTCNVNGIKSLGDVGFGKAWTEYKTNFNRAINSIAQNGYSIVFIAHCNTSRAEDGTVKSIGPILDKQPRKTIEALTDFIFYLQKEVVNDKETVMAYSYLPENIMTKSRIRNLAPSFEFTFENLEKEINKALDNYSNVYGKNVQIGEETRLEDKASKSEEIPFETIKNRVIETASKLLDNPIYNEKATQIIVSAMGGIRLSEAPESYRQILIDLEQELKNLAA